MIENVYLGHDNVVRIIVSDSGTPLNLAGITRMTLELQGAGVVVDSDETPRLIDWSQGGGVVEFELGDLVIAPGTYDATLVAYDPLHTDGQVICHPAGSRLQFRVVE